METCVAIRTNGQRCNVKSNKAVGDGTRCGSHHNSLQLHGPNTMALMELKYVYTRDARDLLMRYSEDVNAAQTQMEKTWMYELFTITNRRMFVEYEQRVANLKLEQNREIRRTGMDPDAAAKQRKREKAAEQLRRQRVRQAAIHQRAREFHAQMIMEERVIHQAGVRELGAFATDPQNVHTAEAVRQTKEIVQRVRMIPVPEEYRWHPINASKTPFEIGMECKLSQKAAWQMMSQYAQSTAIYDIEEGIYGKVLDSVWQYVKNSEDKEDLCRILKQEMEDNYGMCAQGNLSRICNILAGYMEGVGSQESVAERLGRLLPALMDIEDPAKRIMDALKILRENNVPFEEWDTWIEPLKDEDMEVTLQQVETIY